MTEFPHDEVQTVAGGLFAREHAISDTCGSGDSNTGCPVRQERATGSFRQ
jgi:hypothetical protein